VLDEDAALEDLRVLAEAPDGAVIGLGGEEDLHLHKLAVGPVLVVADHGLDAVDHLGEVGDHGDDLVRDLLAVLHGDAVPLPVAARLQRQVGIGDGGRVREAAVGEFLGQRLARHRGRRDRRGQRSHGMTGRG